MKALFACRRKRLNIKLVYLNVGVITNIQDFSKDFTEIKKKNDDFLRNPVLDINISKFKCFPKIPGLLWILYIYTTLEV